MSLLNLTKRALSRPISSSAFIAVGIAFLLFVYKTHSDRSIQQPAITKKMHIQSIPMCEFALRVPPCDPLSGCSQATADARRSARVPRKACRIHVFEYWLTFPGEGSGNNYAYLVTDDKTKQAVIIDPANPSESA